MIGTLINVGTVVVGTLVGRAIGARLPEALRRTTMHGIALLTLAMGIRLSLQSQNFLILLGSMILGGVTGELLRLEAGIERLGALAERQLGRGKAAPGDGSGDFARGFVATSILFCVGPMTILGCLRDGLRGDYSLLAVKATLDGISAVAFASALGWGVLLSAGTVLVVQGSLTLGARALAPVVQQPALQSELFAAGGVMLIGLGLRLLDLAPIRIANFLPALLYAPLFAAAAALRP